MASTSTSSPLFFTLTSGTSGIILLAPKLDNFCGDADASNVVAPPDLAALAVVPAAPDEDDDAAAAVAADAATAAASGISKLEADDACRPSRPPTSY